MEKKDIVDEERAADADVWPASDVLAAICEKSSRPPFRAPLPPFSAGIDCAEYGGDDNVVVICGQAGMLCGWAIDIGSGLEADTGIIVEQVRALVRGEWQFPWPGPDDSNRPGYTTGIRGVPIESHRIALDATGGGKAVYDRLRAEGIHVYPERFATAPIESGSNRTKLDAANYGNRRAQLYGEMARKLDPSRRDKVGFSLPPGYNKLRDDLLAHEAISNRQGKLMLPKKEDVRSRLGRSPDWSDALVMAAAVFDRNRSPSTMSKKDAKELMDWLEGR